MAHSMIDIEYLKQLLELFDASTVNDLRIEQEGIAIKLSKSPKNDSAGQSVPQITYAAAAPQTIPSSPAVAERSADDDARKPAEAPAKEYHEIRSPIVGTFYRSPSPDAPTFVEVGQSVSPGSVLCIVEAMKLMNEIECDCYGKVAKIVVDNGRAVEYNQLLFLIEPE